MADFDEENDNDSEMNRSDGMDENQQDIDMENVVYAFEWPLEVSNIRELYSETEKEWQQLTKDGRKQKEAESSLTSIPLTIAHDGHLFSEVLLHLYMNISEPYLTIRVLHNESRFNDVTIYAKHDSNGESQLIPVSFTTSPTDGNITTYCWMISRRATTNAGLPVTQWFVGDRIRIIMKVRLAVTMEIPMWLSVSPKESSTSILHNMYQQCFHETNPPHGSRVLVSNDGLKMHVLPYLLMNTSEFFNAMFVKDPTGELGLDVSGKVMKEIVHFAYLSSASPELQGKGDVVSAVFLAAHQYLMCGLVQDVERIMGRTLAHNSLRYAIQYYVVAQVYKDQMKGDLLDQATAYIIEHWDNDLNISRNPQLKPYIQELSKHLAQNNRVHKVITE